MLLRPPVLFLGFVLLAACSGSSPGPGTATPSPVSLSQLPSPGTSPGTSLNPDAITLDGTETLSFDVGTGRNGVPACPAADGLTYQTTITLSLLTRAATRTIATVDCASFVDANAALPTKTKTETATATSANVAPLVDAIRALTPYPAVGCGEDGDLAFLTIDRAGVKTVYGDDEGAHCPPVVGVVSAASMTGVLTLANALF